MIISIDAEEAFDKIQHPFMIKTLQKAGIEGKYLNIIKVMYDKPTANIILNGGKLKAFPLKSGTRQGCLGTTTIQHSFGSFGCSNQSRKRNKRNPNWKRRNKILTEFVHDMILYLESPKDFNRKLLELSNEYSKLAGYKINTQKSLAFLYTNSEKTEELRKQSIYHYNRKNKILRNTFT